MLGKVVLSMLVSRLAPSVLEGMSQGEVNSGIQLIRCIIRSMVISASSTHSGRICSMTLGEVFHSVSFRFRLSWRH